MRPSGLTTFLETAFQEGYGRLGDEQAPGPHIILDFGVTYCDHGFYTVRMMGIRRNTETRVIGRFRLRPWAMKMFVEELWKGYNQAQDDTQALGEVLRTGIRRLCPQHGRGDVAP